LNLHVYFGVKVYFPGEVLLLYWLPLICEAEGKAGTREQTTDSEKIQLARAFFPIPKPLTIELA
jgi:hypothetical protein